MGLALGNAPSGAEHLQARFPEPIALAWIDQAMARGKGRDWALGAMEPQP